jgi:hypothetical protein
MSDFTGADLDQLDQLAAQFATAGAEMSARAGELRAKISSAVSTFESTLTGLQSDTSALTAQMNTEMGAVRSQADGVQWTGANRAGFDGDLHSFSSAVQVGTSQIDAGVAGIKAQVDTRFTPVLGEFSAALDKSASGVNDATVTMKTAVDTQRTNLDQAANVGWTSA